MTKCWVAFKQVDKRERQEIALEINGPAVSCDVVLRELGKHLNPAEEWPFAVDVTDCPEDADIGERAVRMHRTKAARDYLGVIYFSYRPEGAVAELSC